MGPFFEKLPFVEQTIRTGLVGGTLRFQTSGHLLRYLLPAWLRRITAKQQQINLQVVEVAEPSLEGLRAGDVDLLVEHLHDIPADLEVQKIAVARAFLVVASNHRQGRGRAETLRLGDLTDETFIAYGADKRSRDLQFQALAQQGVVPQRVHVADSAEAILGFVAAGLGYSLVPSVLANGPREVGVHAQSLTRPNATFPIYAAWRRGASQMALIDLALALAPSEG